MIDVYKRHRVFLNVNSVTDSPTMFSRRVFGLLACGTAVISTESVGIEATFRDLVPIVRTPDETAAQLKRLLDDDEYFAELTAAARPSCSPSTRTAIDSPRSSRRPAPS